MHSVCIYIYIYKHLADTQFPLSFLFMLFPSHCAGGAHCLARGLIRAEAHKAGSTFSGPLEISSGTGAHSARVPISGPLHPSVQQ